MEITSPLGPARPSADQLVRSMSAEFERAIHARTGGAVSPDPVLATLFHAFAVHVERLYDEAESAFPLAVLDDLLSGLALDARVAQPAQTVVRFTEIDARSAVPPELAIAGTNRTGEPLSFSVDQSIELSPARLAFAGIVQKGTCSVLGGAVAPVSNAFVPPGRYALRGISDDAASLFLGIEVDARHLSGLGVYLQVTALEEEIVRRLAGAPWILLGADGVRREAGVMRSADGPGGVRLLRWNDDQPTKLTPTREQAPAGPFGRSLFVFPEFPGDRRWVGRPPALLDTVLATVIPGAPNAYANAKLAWLEVPLPPGSRDVTSILERVILHCTCASNLEIIDETLLFDRHGSTIQTRPEGTANRHVLGALSVIGEHGDWYVSEQTLDAPLDTGRYRLRGRLLEVRPHKNETGRRDRAAVARLRLSDGSRGNGVDVGQLQQLRGGVTGNPRLQARNIEPTRGGAEPADYPAARVRFADLVRTRERIVTTEDIRASVRAFDARIIDVWVASVPRMIDGVLEFADEVSVTLSADSLADVVAEPMTIRERLLKHLTERWMAGRPLTVSVVVAPPGKR